MERITLIDKAISSYERELTEATFCAFFPNDFNYSNSGEAIVNNLKVVLPIKLTSKSAQTYTFKVVLFQGLKSGSGWQDNQSSDGKIRSYWRGSSSYPFNEANYKSICGTILAETSLTFVAEEATSINRWWSFILSNFQIDANRFYSDKRIDIGLIQTGGAAISYNDKTSPSSEINESYSWTSEVAVVPSGTFSNTLGQALDSTNVVLNSSYSPVAGKHKLKASWSYSDSSVSGYEVNLIKGKDELPIYSNKTSSTSTVFDIPSEGDYYFVIQPYTLVGTDYLLGTATLGPHIKFYDLKFIYGGVQKFSFTDSDNNIITSSTSSSTINVNWALDTFTIKKVNEANQESSSGYTPTYLTFSYKINGVTTSTKVNYNTGSLSISNLTSNSTFVLVSVKASVSEPRSSTITLAETADISINKTISTITAASITNLNLVNIKYAMHSNTGDQKVISATANVNFTNFPSGSKTFEFTFGSKTLSYTTPDINGTATIELGINLRNISFDSYSVKVLFGETELTFNYNNQLVNSAVYNHNSTLSFLDNWGISPLVNLDGDLNFDDSNYMLNYLQLILNNYYIPTDTNLLNITANLTQGSKTLSWLNRSLTSTLDLTLKRESLEDFIYDQPITVTIRITSSVFPIDTSNSSSLSIQKSFKITTSCSYNDLTISGGNIIQKYNLIQWKDLGELAYQSARLNPSFIIPDAFTDGGKTEYTISLDENGILDIDNNNLTVTTNDSTPIRSIEITLNIKYTQNGKLIYNGSRSTILTIRDERAPYIPELTLNFGKLVGSFFLPNYSTLEIQNLQTINFPTDLNKKISFYLISEENSEGAESIQRSSIQEIDNLTNVNFDINKIYPSLFTQNNELTNLGIKITASCDGRSNSKDIIVFGKHPAYIEQPQLINIKATSTETASQAEMKSKFFVGALRNLLTYKATAILTNTIDSASESNSKIAEVYNENNNFIIAFSNPLPDYGIVSGFVEILYNGNRLFVSQTKTTGFSKSVGEIAIRKKRVGFHGEPPENHSVAIYAVSNDENAYILSFYDGGIQLGGFQVKNGADIIFSAGKWE